MKENSYSELIFPPRRDDPWMGRRGLVIAGIVFVLAALVAWYSWTQLARPYFHAPVYQPPVVSVVIALVVIVALVVAALGLLPATHSRHQVDSKAPMPWLAGLVAFVFSLLWFVLIALAYNVAPALPAVIPFLCGIVWACVALLLVNHWSARAGWRDTHQLALVFGALIASMLAGFLLRVVVLPIDVIGKLVLNVIAVLGLSYLAWRLRLRGVETRQTSP